MSSTIRIIGFTKKYSHDKAGNVVERDWITYGPAHAIQTVVNEAMVDSLRPSDNLKGDDSGIRGAFLKARWAEIEPAYLAWLAGNELPATGTPLGVWPGITSDQAAALKAAGLRTVEDVATLLDTVIGKVMLPNVRELRTQAQRFLEARDTEAAAQKMVRRDEEVASLKDQLDEALKMLGELTKPQAAPKRGRPRIEVDAEETADEAA